jgi:hypothetical protein
MNKHGFHQVYLLQIYLLGDVFTNEVTGNLFKNANLFKKI